MDISGMTPALSALQSYDAGSSVSQTSLSYAVSTELLSQQLDMTQEMGHRYGSDDGTFRNTGTWRKY